MLRKLLTFGVIAASAPSPIHAQRKISLVSGNMLYDWCNDPGSVEFCTAYVMGAVDAIDTQQFAGAKIDKIPPVICVPENATSRQLVDVTNKHLRDHPAQRAFSAGSEVSLAMLNAFPCPQNRRKNRR
jgi:hypothetical protein